MKKSRLTIKRETLRVLTDLTAVHGGLPTWPDPPTTADSQRTLCGTCQASCLGTCAPTTCGTGTVITF